MDSLNVIILVAFVVIGVFMAFLLGQMKGMRTRIDKMTDGYVSELEEEVETLRARE